jgi:CO dehydrogenase nickel-insertion accessory protein CooC1
LLGEFEEDGNIVIADLEAGVGTLLRMREGLVDLVLVMCEPTTKSIDVASRAAEIAESRTAVNIVANRVRGGDDIDTIRNAFPHHKVVAVAEDNTISAADREGVAPYDYAPNAPGVRAIFELAKAIAQQPSAQGSRSVLKGERR